MPGVLFAYAPRECDDALLIGLLCHFLAASIDPRVRSRLSVDTWLRLCVYVCGFVRRFFYLLKKRDAKYGQEVLNS